MMNEPFKRHVYKEEGYTILEMLIGMSLLFIVMLPVSKIISEVLAEQRVKHKINAVNLAEKEMEFLMPQDVETVGSSEYSEKVDNIFYRVHRTVEKDRNLWRITVQVFHKSAEEPLVELYQYRLPEE